MDVTGENQLVLTADLDRSVSNLHWSQDGKGLYFQYQDKGNNKIAFVSLSGKVHDLVENVSGLNLGRPYTLGTYSVSSNGRIAFTLSNAQHPADLAVVDSRSKIHRITSLNGDLFTYRQLGKVESIWYKSVMIKGTFKDGYATHPDLIPQKNIR